MHVEKPFITQMEWKASQMIFQLSLGVFKLMPQEPLLQLRAIYGLVNTPSINATQTLSDAFTWEMVSEIITFLSWYESKNSAKTRDF